MTLGPIPDYLKPGMRQRFLVGLKNSRSLDTYELDFFRWFRNETEETWQKMGAEEERYIKEQIHSGSEELNDTGILAVDYYRRRMRSSHVIFLASLLEGAMKKECERVSFALGEKILFLTSDLKGDPWTVRKSFLEKYGSFRISEALWKPIRSLLAVRNALVHHSGEISQLPKSEVATLGKIAGVTVDTSELGVDMIFLDNASKSVREVMDFLHGKTNELIDLEIIPLADVGTVR